MHHRMTRRYVLSTAILASVVALGLVETRAQVDAAKLNRITVAGEWSVSPQYL